MPWLLPNRKKEVGREIIIAGWVILCIFSFGTVKWMPVTQKHELARLTCPATKALILSSGALALACCASAGAGTSTSHRAGHAVHANGHATGKLRLCQAGHTGSSGADDHSVELRMIWQGNPLGAIRPSCELHPSLA